MRRLALYAATGFGIVLATAAEAQVAYYATPVVAAPAVAPVVLVAPPVAVVAAPAVPPAIGVRSFYQVKTGGRLASVAKKTGVPLADLVRLNPALNPKAALPAGTLVALPTP